MIVREEALAMRRTKRMVLSGLPFLGRILTFWLTHRLREAPQTGCRTTPTKPLLRGLLALARPSLNAPTAPATAAWCRCHHARGAAPA